MNKLILMSVIFAFSLLALASSQSFVTTTYDDFSTTTINQTLWVNTSLVDISSGVARVGTGGVGTNASLNSTLSFKPLINSHLNISFTVDSDIGSQPLNWQMYLQNTTGRIMIINTTFHGGFGTFNSGILSISNNSIVTTYTGNVQNNTFSNININNLGSTWRIAFEVYKRGSTSTGEVLKIDNVNYTAKRFLTELITPSNASMILSANSNFTVNLTGNNVGKTNNTFLNATLYIWDNNGSIGFISNKSLSGINNYTNFSVNGISLGLKKWNVLACQSNNVCEFATANSTFTLGGFTEEFDPTLIEGQSTNINLNITFEGVNPNILATLFWNNTLVSPSKEVINSSVVRFTGNFVVPVGVANNSGVNISHYWRFYLPDGTLNDTTNLQYQNVFSLGFDNCTVFSSLLLNYTMYDEDAVTLLPNGAGTNSTIEVDLTATSLADETQQTNFSRTYSQTNNARVCISSIASGFRIDSQVRYTANNYVVEFHNIQNATLSASNFPQNIQLFPLLSSRSQEFLVTYKDQNFVPIQGALITITRKYVGEGLFRTVEAPLTNNDGQALVHLVLGDVIYTIVVSKDGVLLGTFDNIVPFCTNIATGECQINLNSFIIGTQPSDFETKNNLTYRFVFDKDARTITTVFSTVDGSVATINFTGTLFDNRGNSTVCSTSLTTSSGSLVCTVPVSFGNSTIRGILYKDGEFIESVFFNLNDANDTGFGMTGILMLAIMYITIPLMMITSTAGIVISAIIGLIFAGLLNLYTGGSIIGIGSTLMWFIIAGFILVWKINQGRNA